MMEQGGEQLGSAARALLDAARDGLAPDAAAVRRVRDKVAASTGAAAATGIAVKLGIVGVVAAVAIGTGIYATRGGDDAPSSPSIDLRAASDGAARPGSPGLAITMPSTGSESSPVVVRPTTPAAEPEPIEMAPQSAQRARPVVQLAAQADGVDLAREVELIDSAMAALKRGDAQASLSFIRTHARETRGHGQLAEDASAIEVEALCRLHDPAVAAKLDAFDTRFPRSAQRSRLTTVCK